MSGKLKNKQRNEFEWAAFSNFQKAETVQKDESEEGQINLDVYETAKQLIIVAPIAGVKLDDITLTITDDVLSIKGNRKNEFAEISDDDYLIQECFWGKFSRSIVLPDNIDGSKIQAGFKDGILKITIPKTSANKTKLIKINYE